MSVNVDHSKHFSKTPGKKRNQCKRSRYLLCLLSSILRLRYSVDYFRSLFHLSICSLCYIIIKSKPAPKLPPHAIDVDLSPPCPFPCPFLAIPKLEFRARHLLEMATCVVTETILSRRYFATPFLPIDPPYFPPTTIAASWSKSCCPLPRVAESFSPLKCKVSDSMRQRTHVSYENSVGACASRR